MEVFTAAPHGDVLKLLFQLAVLLATARLFGHVAQRSGQPSVVGELLAGIVLGPSCLSALFPPLRAAILPQTPLQGYLLETVSLLGAIFLLLVTGFAADLAVIRRHARIAAGVAAGGLVLPLVSGFALGELLPDRLLAAGGSRLLFSMFVATAMSISAIPVIAKVLMDLDLMRREIGQTIVAAAVIDDTTGWILLSMVASLARGEVVTAASVLQAVASVAGFMVLSFTIGAWLVRRALDLVEIEGGGDRTLTLVVALTLAWATLTHLLRLEPVLGAFVMGILFGRLPRLSPAIRQQLTSMAMAIFAPIFFAVAGLKVDAASLLRPDLASITLVVIVVATAGKVIGTYAGARLVGRQGHWTALAFGAALNARGAMEIIVATIGLSLGILTREMFSIIVVMAMTTSLMAPAALRWLLRHRLVVGQGVFA
jgi:Kef-type K+ transport system membrane component KefB